MQLSKKNKILAVIIILALMFTGAIWGFVSISERIGESSQNNNSPARNIASVREALKNTFNNELSKNLKSDGDRVNMLLLGISGDDHISGELTDSIIFTSINKQEKSADMFSIPRDLWVSDPEDNFQKINELYKIGGGTSTPDVAATGLMKEKVEEITGQTIHYSGVINLDGVQEIVDLLGGVKTEEGLMSGEEALWYIRDRSRPGGDFDRMARQQKLILAIMQKFKNLDFIQDINQLQELHSALERNLAMDVPLTETMTLINFIGQIKTEDVGLYTITPDQEGLLYSDFSEWEGLQVYTLHPRAGMEDYSEIQNFIGEILN